MQILRMSLCKLRKRFTHAARHVDEQNAYEKHTGEDHNGIQGVSPCDGAQTAGPYVEDHDHKKQQCTDAPGDKPVSRHLNDDAAAQKLNGNIRDRKADHQQNGRYIQRAGVIFIVKKINRSTVVPQTALLPQRLAEHTEKDAEEYVPAQCDPVKRSLGVKGRCGPQKCEGTPPCGIDRTKGQRRSQRSVA